MRGGRGEGRGRNLGFEGGQQLVLGRGLAASHQEALQVAALRHLEDAKAEGAAHLYHHRLKSGAHPAVVPPSASRGPLSH